MKTTLAWGWLAAGVLALGLNGFYQDGGLQSVHQFFGRVGHRSAAVLALATGRADEFVAETQEVATHSNPLSCPRFSANAESTRFQARIDRQTAAMVRAEVQSADIESAMAELRASTENLKALDCQLAKLRTMKTINVSVPNISLSLQDVGSR